MKAAVCKAYGPPPASVVLDDIPAPEPKEGEVLVDVKACGINFPDVLIVQDMYQFKAEPPFVPGGEYAGVVSKLGPGVTNLQVGDKVMMSLTSTGGLAEQAVAPAAGCAKMPEGMPFEEAAGFLLTYLTSHYALKHRAHLKPGENLVVLGAAGGVGIAAVELGKAMGARVVACASSEEKLELCRARGADETLLYPSGGLDKAQQKELSNQLKALTGGKGADVVYDPIGGDFSEPAIRATNWDGRFLVIGFVGGIPRIPTNLALLKSCQIVGVFLGGELMRDAAIGRQMTEELAALYTQGKVRPQIGKVYPLEESGQAIADLAARKAKGKVIVKIAD